MAHIQSSNHPWKMDVNRTMEKRELSNDAQIVLSYIVRAEKYVRRHHCSLGRESYYNPESSGFSSYPITLREAVLCKSGFMTSMRAQKLENEKQGMMKGIDELIDKRLILPLNEEWAYVLTPEGKGLGIRVYPTEKWTIQEAKKIRRIVAKIHTKNRVYFKKQRYAL